MEIRVYVVVCTWLSFSVRSNVIDFNTMPMTLLNATNFILQHQRYLQDDENTDAAPQISDNEGGKYDGFSGYRDVNENVLPNNNMNMNIDENVKSFVNSPLVLTTEVCNPGKCQAGKMEGVCISGESCSKHGGQARNPCNGSSNLICCTFLLTCGDVSSQKVVYLQSPDSLKIDSGSIACDYDVMVQKDMCVVRVDYERLNLASKIGGVCDIDQVYILNSDDGPTTGQCGPLTGYSTVVPVKPNQEKPLKIALVVQSEPTEYWLIKVSQIGCSEIKPFKESPDCGLSRNGPLNNNGGRGGSGGSGGGNPLSSPHLTPAFDSAGRCDDDGVAGESMGRRRHRIRRRTAAGGGSGGGAPDVPRRRWNRPVPTTTSPNANRYRTAGGQQAVEPESRDDDENRRIIGGTDANVGEFTWQAAIALDGLFFCGGALIDDRFVITAAHCVMTRDTPVDNLLVHLGDYDLTTVNETEHQVRKVARVMFHSHFHPFLLVNDIALLQLHRPVTTSKTIRPVCLPPANGDSYVGLKGMVVGWGITSFPLGNPSPTLQKLYVEVLSNFQCSLIINDNVGLGMLCAAAPLLQGTCFGDSGGSLTIERDTGQNALIGLVSYGVIGCAARPAFPDLYTRVSEYIKWIDVNTSL